MASMQAARVHGGEMTVWKASTAMVSAAMGTDATAAPRGDHGLRIGPRWLGDGRPRRWRKRGARGDDCRCRRGNNWSRNGDHDGEEDEEIERARSKCVEGGAKSAVTNYVRRKMPGKPREAGHDTVE